MTSRSAEPERPTPRSALKASGSRASAGDVAVAAGATDGAGPAARALGDGAVAAGAQAPTASDGTTIRRPTPVRRRRRSCGMGPLLWRRPVDGCRRPDYTGPGRAVPQAAGSRDSAIRIAASRPSADSIRYVTGPSLQ